MSRRRKMFIPCIERCPFDSKHSCPRAGQGYTGCMDPNVDVIRVKRKGEAK